MSDNSRIIHIARDIASALDDNANATNEPARAVRAMHKMLFESLTEIRRTIAHVGDP